MDIYTDGSCLGNPGSGGWAYIIILNDDNDNIFKSECGNKKYTTNNVMELYAIKECLEYIYENLETLPEIPDLFKKITIYTDSNYCKQGITTWSIKWKQNGWKSSTSKPIKNIDLWKRIISLNELIKSKNIHIEWVWVKAHDTNKYNNMVDIMARSQASMLQ